MSWCPWICRPWPQRYPHIADEVTANPAIHHQLPISSSAIINAQIAVASALTPFQPQLSSASRSRRAWYANRSPIPRRSDPRRLLGFFMSLLLSCHLAVKADHMALHHAPMTKHYLAALAAGHRYGLCFSVEYQSGFCFRADSFHMVIFSVPNCQGSDQANPHRRDSPRRSEIGEVPF